MTGADATKKKRKNKPPKGFAQLPEWWMEVTPHHTLDVEEDEAKRLSDSKQAMLYRDLAAKSDWEQVNGESKFTVGQNGELIDKETGEAIDTGGDSGYTRDEKTGEWLKDGKPIFGRKFNADSNTSSGYGHKALSIFTNRTMTDSTTVSRDECLHLNDILGSKTLSSCYNLKHTLRGRDDSFHTNQGISEDDTQHRNSWLMPRMARRMTTKSRYHVSQWRPEVKVDDTECARLRALLMEKMGSAEDAQEHLPAACKRMEH